jgi:hypothetical protein
MLIAVPLVITMAVGLVLGLRFMGERNASLNLGPGRWGGDSQPAATATASHHPRHSARPSRRAAKAPG